MASILQQLLTPLFSGPVEPPRNKVTVVGVGMVGMASAVSVLLKVRQHKKTNKARYIYGWLGSTAV